MANLRPEGPYIWVTWLTRLLTGDNSCEWSSWFRSQHESSSWDKMPSDFDSVKWNLNHTALLNKCRDNWELDGYSVLTEESFTLKGNTATVAGKIDLIAEDSKGVVVIDAKTGKPSPSHGAQILIYMYALPIIFKRYKDIKITGQIAYPDHTVDIPASALTEQFVDNLTGLIRRIASSDPARKVPGRMECKFCDITPADCPEKITGDTGVGKTNAF